MRTLPAEVQAYLQGSDIIARTFVWITARNRTTNAAETIGIWNGEDTQTFTVNGAPRVYVGGGGFIGLSDIVYETGLSIRKATAKVSPITPEIEQVLRGYDPKMAPVEVHLGLFSTETRNLIAPPTPMFIGWIDRFPINTGVLGKEATGAIEMVGHTRHLTRRLTTKRSHESQQRRLGTDTFFKDVTLTGSVITPWGSKQ